MVCNTTSDAVCHLFISPCISRHLPPDREAVRATSQIATREITGSLRFCISFLCRPSAPHSSLCASLQTIADYYRRYFFSVLVLCIHIRRRIREKVTGRARENRMHWKGSGGWGTGSPYGRMYDPKTVETISGEIAGIESFRPVKGMGAGVPLLLKTDKETISVHLGPAWFIENQDLKLEEKERIVVRGSRVTYQEKPAIIAAEVTKGNETLPLRDDAGVPVWSGWRRR